MIPELIRQRVRADLLEDAFRTLLAKLDSTGVPQGNYWDWDAFARLVDHIASDPNVQADLQAQYDAAQQS